MQEVMVISRRGDRYRLGPWQGHTGAIALADQARAQALLARITSGPVAHAALRSLLQSLRLPVQRMSDHEILTEVARRLAWRQLQIIVEYTRDAQIPGGAVEDEPEPSPAQPKRKEADLHWIEIVLVDEEDYPVSGVDYELQLPDGKKKRGRTDRAGVVRADGIEAGTCSFSYHELDEQLWLKIDPPGNRTGREPIRITRTWRRYDARYEVRQGDSVESIAARSGHLWETIWQHAENAELRQQRKTGHVLYPGDALFVPRRRPRVESLATDQQHAFRYRSIPSKLRVQFLQVDEPRASVPYEIDIDGETREGQLDGSGILEQPLSPLAERATVRLMDAQQQDPQDALIAETLAALGLEPETPAEPPVEAYELDLRHLDPTGAVSGVQGRLRNYGFDIGEIDGELDERTRDALRAFQFDQGLSPSGEIDEASRAKLHEITHD